MRKVNFALISNIYLVYQAVQGLEKKILSPKLPKPLVKMRNFEKFRQQKPNVGKISSETVFQLKLWRKTNILLEAPHGLRKVLFVSKITELTRKIVKPFLKENDFRLIFSETVFGNLFVDVMQLGLVQKLIPPAARIYDRIKEKF